MKRIGMLIMGCMIFFSCASQRPQNLGVNKGRLAACPSRPNCVNSQSADQKQKIAPFEYQGERVAVINRLKEKIASFDRATIVKESEDYLHIEFRSRFMGFADDVEFFFPRENIIHVRSASRLGYSDFGVNRKRVEQLRQLLSSDHK